MLDNTPEEMDLDIQRILLHTAKPPHKDATSNMLEVFCRNVVCAENDGQLKAIQQQHQLSNEAADLLRKSVQTLVDDGFGWDYIYGLAKGIMKDEHIGIWTEWVSLAHSEIDPASWAAQQKLAKQARRKS